MKTELCLQKALLMSPKNRIICSLVLIRKSTAPHKLFDTDLVQKCNVSFETFYNLLCLVPQRY